MPGLIGKKIGMTSIFSAEGKNLPCTIIEAGPCVVTQIKTQEKDGYKSVQLGFDEKKEKNTPKAMLGHFAKAKSTPKRKIIEFKGFDESLQHSEDYYLSKRYNPKQFKISKHYIGQDDRRFKKMGYYGMIKLVIKSYLNRNNLEFFKRDVNYWV